MTPVVCTMMLGACCGSGALLMSKDKPSVLVDFHSLTSHILSTLASLSHSPYPGSPEGPALK